MILALALVLSFVLGGIVMAASVDPVFYPMCRGGDLGAHPDPADCFISTGDAYYECNQIGEYDFAKRTGPTTGEWPLVETGTFLQWVTVTMVDETSFNWSATPNAVGAVIVKSVGTGMQAGGYNVYSYDPAVDSDSNLSGVTVDKTNGHTTIEHTFDINHITFCWDLAGVCMEDETAWAEGFAFDPNSGWAMYVPYFGEEMTVDLIAGQNEVAGDVTFSVPEDGWVDITITLTGDWIFYYDVEDDEQDDNIKIQDYTAEPNENTKVAPGLFDWKAAADIDDVSFTITVEENNFYAVHVDLATGEPCE
jgi:hypothetical protein